MRVLTMHESMSLGNGEELGREPLMYDVRGLPAGREARIRKRPGDRWAIEIRETRDGTWPAFGETHESAEAARAALEAEFSN
jgi:hypothetical protein